MTAPDPPPDASPARITRRRLLLGAGGAAVAGTVGWVVLGPDDGTDDRAGPTTSTSRPDPTTTAPSTSTASTTTSPTLPTFDVRDFGARGDGRTDDSAALRAAFDAALAESHRLNEGTDPTRADRAPTVVVPAGHYLCPELVGVPIDAPITVRGQGAAVLDAVRPASGAALHHVATVLTCTSAIDVEGLELRQGGVWLSFATMTHDTTLLRIAGCTFRGGRAPASSWPGGDAVPHGPDRMIIEGNVVEGPDSREAEAATSGFGLELTRWASAVVRDNRITGVYQNAIRVGHQARSGRPYSDRPDLTCSGNVIDGVWGDVKSNGIVVAASDIRITDNQVHHVTSGADESRGVGDTEGIYVKGEGIVVSGNTLVDGGRLQAQITVKGSDAVIEGNRITCSPGVFSGGIRIEGLRTEIRGNHITGIPEDYAAVSVQDNPDSDTIVLADNVIEGGHPKYGIVVGRRREVVVTGNRISGPAETGAIVVRSEGDGRIDRIEVRGNEVTDAARTDAVLLVASDPGGEVGAAVVADNSFVDVGRAVQALAFDGGTIDSVEVEGNRYEAVDSPVEASSGVPLTRTADG